MLLHPCAAAVWVISLLGGAAAAAELEGELAHRLEAIVRIHADVPAEARTAAYLGTTRDGAGGVSDDAALVVPMGCLIRGDAVAGSPANMFVPIERLQPVMGDLLALGRPASSPRPWLGINLRELDGKLVVGRVAADGPGDRAGVRHGDRVTAIDGA